jgi:uncharacterized protein (UPF0216 family)
MADDDKADYKVGYKKPPLHSRFKKGQSGNARGRPRGSKNFSTLLTDALNEPVVVTEDGRRRKISKRELGFKQLANKFAMAEAQATKMLLGLMLERERLAAAAAPAERPSFGAADEKVIANLLKRLRSSE